MSRLGQHRLDALADIGSAAVNAEPGAAADAWQQPVRLREISQADFRSYADFLRKPFVWEDDGYCLGRAALGAMHVNHADGRGLSPADDAVAGALAIVKGRDADEPLRSSGWLFHAGLVVQPEGMEPQVIDYLTSSEPMPLDDWAIRYGLQPDRIDIRSPYASWDGADITDFEWFRAGMKETWRAAADRGYVDHVLEEPPARAAVGGMPQPA